MNRNTCNRQVSTTPTIVTYNCLIRASAQQGLWERSLEILQALGHAMFQLVKPSACATTCKLVRASYMSNSVLLPMVECYRAIDYSKARRAAAHPFS